jgi:hypothetical protein
MFYGGEANVPGAPGNLNPRSIARGIPVGRDPLLPMDQDQFSDWVRYNLDKNKPLRPQGNSPVNQGPQLPGFLNRGASLPGAPGNFAGIPGPQFYTGSQQGQIPQGFQNKIVYG